MEAAGLIDQLLNIHRNFYSLCDTAGQDTGFGRSGKPRSFIELAADFGKAKFDSFVGGWDIHVTVRL